METINENEAQDKRSLKKAFLAVVCACALTLAGVFAYLTATDQVKNLFSLADKIEIEVVEPNWNPDDAKGMLPTQTVAKDPAIHNKNKAGIYVFADVVIPQKNIVTANADGTLNESAVVDLFSYELNEGWTLKDTIANDDGTVTYRYVHNDVVPADGTTPSLFDEVTLVNYVNEQFNTEELAQQIVINGYGAQALGFANAEEAYASYFAKNEVTLSTLTVNDPAIEIDQNYQVVALPKTLSVSSAPAQTAEQVIFKNVTLEQDAKYAVVAEGSPVEEAITEFTADEDFLAAASETASASVGVDQRQAFAVYSADDNSLNFYKRTSVPAAGEHFEGKAATAIYTNFESSFNSPSWRNQKANVTNSAVIDNGITPISTAYWFDGFTKLTSVIGLEKLDCSKLTHMQYMFNLCTSLSSVDLTGINTHKVVNMHNLFYSCGSFTSLDLSNFDTSSVVDMNGMFSSCWGLTSLDLSSFDTSQVTDMSRMFGACSSLTSLDLSSFHPSNTTDLSNMFINCSGLTTVYSSPDADWSNADKSSDMFTSCIKINGSNGTTYDSSHTDASYARIDGLNGQPGYFTAK